jgi:hypothetical protein
MIFRPGNFVSVWVRYCRTCGGCGLILNGAWGLYNDEMF